MELAAVDQPWEEGEGAAVARPAKTGPTPPLREAGAARGARVEAPVAAGAAVEAVVEARAAIETERETERETVAALATIAIGTASEIALEIANETAEGAGAAAAGLLHRTAEAEGLLLETTAPLPLGGTPRRLIHPPTTSTGTATIPRRRRTTITTTGRPIRPTVLRTTDPRLRFTEAPHRAGFAARPLLRDVAVTWAAVAEGADAAVAVAAAQAAGTARVLPV